MIFVHTMPTQWFRILGNGHKRLICMGNQLDIHQPYWMPRSILDAASDQWFECGECTTFSGRHYRI